MLRSIFSACMSLNCARLLETAHSRILFACSTFFLINLLLVSTEMIDAQAVTKQDGPIRVVSGPPQKQGSSLATPPVEVTAPVTFQGVPSTFTIPITVDDITGDGIISFQFNIIYNPAVIDPSGPNFGCSTTGTLAGAAGTTAFCNVVSGEEGRLRVAAFGAVSMTGSGPILNLTFTTDPTAAPLNVSPLTFNSVFFFASAGEVANNPHNGQVTLLGPTAANATISGRVTTAGGQGIRNVRVVIYGNTLAQPRSAITSAFGYYSLEDLAAGETYLLTVNSKRYTFTVQNRVIELLDNISDADFVADPL